MALENIKAKQPGFMGIFTVFQNFHLSLLALFNKSTDQIPPDRLIGYNGPKFQAPLNECPLVIIPALNSRYL
jgi:hypothetical protein